MKNKERMDGFSLGLSVADYAPNRRHTSPDIYKMVDHIEYGGFEIPENNPEISFALSSNASLKLGRHLVSTELPSKLNLDEEVARINTDQTDHNFEYFLTDVEYWHIGGRDLHNVWPRPCCLTQEVVEQVVQNCRSLKERLGTPVFAENPAIIAIDAEMTMADFLSSIANGGVGICLDIGHFWAFCMNFNLPLEQEVEKLPLSAIKVMHIAGLSKVNFCNQTYYIDNHDVVPNWSCLDLLGKIFPQCPNLKWITYEAELADEGVQITGLMKIREVLKR